MILNRFDKVSLYRLMVIVVFIAALAVGCLYILAPFMPAILLATILSLSAWPAFAWLDEKLGHRPTLSAGLMTLLLACAFLIPLILLTSSMTEDFSKLYAMTVTGLQTDFSKTPDWITNMPLVGGVLGELWGMYVQDKQSLIATLHQNAGPISQMLIHYGGMVGHGILDLSLGVLIAFFFFRNGTQAAQLLHSLIQQFGGDRGRHLLTVSKNTMIAVVYGILGTAVLEGVLAAIGLWIAHVPGPAFLGVLTIVMSFVPCGFAITLVPIVLWLFHSGAVGMGVFLAIWSTAILSFVDMIIRPYFISIGSSLPLLLVLLGVFGGIISFGFIGLFIGPTLLAVAYALVTELGRGEKDSAIANTA